MDNVTINSNIISSLTANRDAINSNVTVSRSIGNLVIGGNVQNTNVNVGQQQSLFSFANAAGVCLRPVQASSTATCRRLSPILK